MAANGRTILIQIKEHVEEKLPTTQYWAQLDFMLGHAPGIDNLQMDDYVALSKAIEARDAEQLLRVIDNILDKMLPITGAKEDLIGEPIDVLYRARYRR